MTAAATPHAAEDVRDAATVVILRPGATGGAPEVLLLRRHTRAGFAADAWVFPGGVVDAADRTLSPARWTGVDPEALAARTGVAPDLVVGQHVAAVREAFEESGLLLALHGDGSPVALDEPWVAPLRAALNDRQADAAAFADALAEHDVVLDLGRLTYHSRWITPVGEPRRYDTAFFLARAPHGQLAAHDRGEITGQRWITARDALQAQRHGLLHVIYPTIRTLEALAEHGSLDQLEAVARAQERIELRRPVLVVDADGRPLRLEEEVL